MSDVTSTDGVDVSIASKVAVGQFMVRIVKLVANNTWYVYECVATEVCSDTGAKT